MTVKKIKMVSTANYPVFVPQVGEVPVGGEFEVDPEYANELENGLFKKAKKGTK